MLKFELSHTSVPVHGDTHVFGKKMAQSQPLTHTLEAVPTYGPPLYKPNSPNKPVLALSPLSCHHFAGMGHTAYSYNTPYGIERVFYILPY
jgi:hypothetical protein